MKKVKTIIASLMIMCATAIMSACSCSGNTTPGVTPVAVDTISITSEFEGSVRNPETGYLDIKCGKGDAFTITYSLGPTNTTQTQVNWEIDHDDVVGSRNGIYSYSQSHTQNVTFVAKKAGSATIKFYPFGTTKFTYVYVRVSEAKADRSTFLAPSGLDYNPTTGKVTWNAVTKVQKPNRDIIDAPSENGLVSGLSGYLVTYTNLETGEQFSTPKDQPIIKCEYELPRGNTYAVSVSARGDDFTVNDSASSETLKFHQLGVATELNNNNGVISFVSSKYSKSYDLHFGAKKPFNTDVNGVQKITLRYDEAFDKIDDTLNEYNISVVLYPEKYDVAVNEGKNYIEISGIRYYASISTETIKVQKLLKPQFTISHKMATSDNPYQLNGLKFVEDITTNQPHLGSILSWDVPKVYEDKYKVKFRYNIFKGNVRVYPAENEYAEGTSFDMSSLWSQAGGYEGDYTLKVFAYGDKSNTITSQVSEYKFILLGKMTSASLGSDNVLSTGRANSYIQGVDLFFLKKSTNGYEQAGSKFVFVDVNDTNGSIPINIKNIDITEYNLSAGEYDIYGRFVGINSNAKAPNPAVNSATGEICKLNSKTIRIADAVDSQSISISSDSILKFKPVSGAEYFKDYIITLFKNGETDKFTISNNDYTIVNGYVQFDMAEKLSDMTGSAKITVTTKGVNDDNSDGIDSAVSSVIEFSRLNKVDENNITLNNYVLTFPTENSYEYMIRVDGTNYEAKVMATSTEMQVNLNTLNVQNKTFAEIISELVNADNGVTEIKINIQGYGGQASNTGTKGKLNGFVSSKTFELSNTPSNTKVQVVSNDDPENPSTQNLLTWSVSEVVGQRFTLKFYVSNDNWATRTLRKTVTLEESDTQNMSGYYGYDINQILEENFKNQVVGITVSQSISSRFNGQESTTSYAIALGEVELISVIDTNNSNEPSIKFTTLDSADNINYILTVAGKDPITIKPETKGQDIIRTLKNLGIADTNTYSVAIKAKLTNDNADTSISKDIPFGFDSNETSIEIRVISSQIGVTANEKNVVWTSIHSQAQYTLEYKTTGEWTKVAENLSGNINELISYNLFDIPAISGVSGNILVRVIPTLDYEVTGCLLTTENAKENTIVKLNKAKTVSVSNGTLTYTLSDTFLGVGEGKRPYVITLFANGNMISNDEYTVDYQNQTITINSSNYIGENEFAIQISSVGYLTSDISNSVKARMITTSNDLDKVGDYIVWTPDKDATKYVLTFNKDGETKSTQTIHMSGVVVENDVVISATVSYEVIDGEDKIKTVDENVVKFENGKIMFKFTNELLGENAEPADYYFVVKGYTDKGYDGTNNLGYLSGVTSSPITITKLSSTLNISANGEFVLNGYTPAGTQNPEALHYEVYINKANVFNKNTAWSDISFDMTASEYEIVFESKAEDGTYSVISTKKVRIINEQIEYFKDEETGYVSDSNVISLSNQTITLKASAIPTNSEDATKDTQRIVVNYAEKVYTSEDLPYASVEAGLRDGGEGEPFKIDLNELGLSDFGSYFIKLKLLGNNARVVDSELVTSEVYERLTTTKAFTKNGVITWEEVAGATYKVKVTGVWEEQTGEEASATQSIVFDMTTNTLSEDDIKANNAGTGLLINELYNIQILTYANGKLSSTWGDKFEFKKLLAPNNLVIKASTSSATYQVDPVEPDPENPDKKDTVTISVGDPMLTWNDPNNTTENLNYMYAIGEDQEITIYNPASSGAGKLIGQLLDKNKAQGSYSIRMRVQGNTTLATTNSIGLLTSDQSDEIIVTYVTETPNVGYSVENSNKKFGWTAVDGANLYKIEFKQKDKTLYTTYTTNNSYDFKNTEFDGVGYFNFVVSAVTDPTKTIVSTFEYDKNTNFTVLYKSPSAENVFVRDGRIAWSISISDLRDMLTPYQNGTYKSEGLSTDLGMKPSDDMTQKAIEYLNQKINLLSAGGETADSILAPLYRARLSLNGVETIISANGMEVCQKVGNEFKANASGEYLVFNYNMSTTINSIDTEEQVSYKAGQYSVKVAPVGNNISTNLETGVISSVDGKYKQELIAFKPYTPSAWSNDNKLEVGKALWKLVPKATETTEYHTTYKLFAKDAEKKIYVRDVNTSDGGNISDISYYSRQLTEIFADYSEVDKLDQNIAKNTNYNLYLSVVGTPNSLALTDDAKAYLNSDIYSYGDEYMNILSNIELKVSNSNISWATSNGSTSTKLFIYGPFKEPFKYAPDRLEYTNETDYNNALSTWKNGISSQWNKMLNVAGTTEQEYETYKKLRHVIDFDEIRNGEGEETVMDRVTKYTISGNSEYGVGSYIIRKQEIGNGKGVIDTERIERLFVTEGNPLEQSGMGLIATKLDMTSSTLKISNEDIWVEKGMFKWKSVPKANAYRVTLKDTNGTEYGDYSTLIEAVAGDVQSFDIPTIKDPNDSSVIWFNDASTTYTIDIIATHVDSIEEGILANTSDNYFDGDKVETKGYSRVAVPIDLTIDDLGTLSWNSDNTYTNIQGFAISIIHNNENIKINPITGNKYSLTKEVDGKAIINEPGEYAIKIRALGKSSVGEYYLNGSESETITVTKLPTPTVSIQNGVFKWGTESTELINKQLAHTEFKLDRYENDSWTNIVNKTMEFEDGNDENENGVLNETYTSYPLFGEITSYNNSYNLNDEMPIGKYKFSVRYSPNNASQGTQFVITSAEQTLETEKLSAPVLENVKIDLGDNVSTNRVRWQKIDKAEAYRALVITQVKDENEAYIDKIFDGTSINSDDNEYIGFFSFEGDYGYLDISKVIDRLGANIDNGATLKVYVQAIGSLNYNSTSSSDAYISSSFSNVKNIEIPASPTSANFDQNTGRLSWNIDESKGHNVQIVMSYKVSDVSADEFYNYWIKTADTYKTTGESEVNGNANRPYAQIKNRHFDYTINTNGTYNLTVSDIVFIEAENGKTPNSYQLTNVGTEYNFGITIMVGTADSTGNLKSKTFVRNAGDSFAVFNHGDGSTMLPYNVSNFVQLNSIRYFTQRHFEVDENINIKDGEQQLEWNMITDDFTGSIVGIPKKYNESLDVVSNPTISVLSPKAYQGTNLSIYQAFMLKNAGTIKNLNFEINFNLGASGNKTVRVAGLAIENTGIIDNVNISTTHNGTIKVTANSAVSETVRVAGITTNNQGTISNSSVKVGENTTTQTFGIYSLNDGKVISQVAGIANQNSGTISKTFFSGDITSNYVGGITNENEGTIDRCYSLGNVNVVDKYLSSTSGNGKDVIYGGIAGTMTKGVISNSYSRLTLKLTSSFNIITNIGGLVGNIQVASNESALIKNCYVVVNFTKDTTSAGNSGVYYFVSNSSTNLNCKNNFYMVESANNIGVETTINGVSKVSQISDLNNALKDLKENGSNIYVTDLTYPYLVGMQEA